MKSWEATWREIEEAYNVPYFKRSTRQRNIAALGFCHAMRETNRDYDIPKILIPSRGGYWWRRDDEGCIYRVFFAGLMAAMGDEGFESFLEWCREHPK